MVFEDAPVGLKNSKVLTRFEDTSMCYSGGYSSSTVNRTAVKLWSSSVIC